MKMATTAEKQRIYNPPLEERIEEVVLQRIKQDAEYAQQGRSDETSDWQTARKLYNSEWTELEADLQETSLFIPQIRMYVMRIISGLMLSYFGGESFAELRAKTLSGLDPVAAEMMEPILDYYLRERVPWYETTQQAIEDAGVDGTCGAKLCWRKASERDYVTGEGPQLMSVPIEDLLIDPFPRQPQDIRYIIHWREIDLDELWEKQEQGIYRNVDKVAAHLAEQQAIILGPGQEAKKSSAGQTQTEGKQTVRIYEYYGRLQMTPSDELAELRKAGKNVKPRDIICTTYEDKAILQGPIDSPYAKLREHLSPLKKLPFVIGRLLPKKHEVWGWSLPVLGKSLQEEQNRIRNERRKNVLLMLNPVTLVDRNSGLDVSQAEEALRTGGMIFTDDVTGSMNQRTIGNVTESSYREETINCNNQQELFGVSDYNQGMNRPGMTDTATGISILTEQANTRIALYGQNFSKSFVVPLLEKLIDYIVEWADPKEIQKILGTKTVPPPLKTFLKREYDIRVETGIAAESKSVKTRQLQFALQVIGQSAGADPEAAQAAYRKLLLRLLPLLGAESAAQEFARGGQPGGQAVEQANAMQQGPVTEMESQMVNGRMRPRTPEELRRGIPS